MYKQAILVRADLKMPKGKIAVQVAHASVGAILNEKNKEKINKWFSEGGKKIVLKVKGLEQLLQKLEEAKKSGLNTYIVVDAGLTVVPPGTVTCGAIGPESEELIDKIVGDLKLL